MPTLSRRRLLATGAGTLAAAGLLGACRAPAPSGAARAEHTTSAGPVEVTRMAGGLDVPWSLAFVPDGFLVTERPGRLLHISGGAARPVGGVPEVFAEGQGGLLDVVAARDFPTSRAVFLTYAEPRPGGNAATALAVARLSPGNARLDDLRVLWRMTPATGTTVHFGSRVAEAPDGTLFITTGDRGARDAAQDLSDARGKLVRINRDGSIPASNPFVQTPGALPEIWSFGLRNLQGIALDDAGAIWTVMHGPRGGDEVNRHAEPGRNYGWPVQSFGREYVSRRAVGTAGPVPGMTDPLFVWPVSPAVSGLAICSGRLFPAWRGNLLTGALQHDTIIRLSRSPTGLRESERLLQGAYPRIRDVREAPDGAIWFIAEAEGAVYRITPAGTA